VTKTVFAALLLFACRVASAADYPTAPDDMDKLCEVIGEAPNLSVPPKDRLWFKENCTCAGKAGCGNISSDRFGQRLAAAKAAREAQEKEAAEAKDAKEKKAAAAKAAREAQQRAAKAASAARKPQRLAYWKCIEAVVPGVTPSPPAGQRACEKETAALEKACGRGVAWSTCIELDKGEMEVLLDIKYRANTNSFCPVWRDRGTYGTGGQEAAQLFEKYCTEWAVVAGNLAEERKKQEAEALEVARAKEARQQAEREQKAVAVCSPYLKCRESRDVNECGSERYLCFVACNDLAEGLVYPPTCELAHKATFGK